MKFTVEEVSPIERKLIVEIDADEKQAMRQQVLKKTMRTAKLKGFRPGKAPAALVESQYAGQINTEVLEKLLDRYYPEALAQSGLHPLNQPQINITSMDEDFSFTALFEVFPAFTLESSAYLGMELRELGLEADQTAVDKAIEQIRRHRAEVIEVQENRPAIRGDIVVADYQIFDLNNGEALADKVLDAELELDEGQLLEPLETLLLGAETGQCLETEVEFPQEEPNPRLQGKKTRFSFEIKGLKKRSLPELNLEFVQNLWPEMESLEQFREKVQADLNARFQQQNEQHMRQQIVDKISNLAEFDIPPCLVRDEQERMLERLKNYMYNEGVPSLSGFDDDSLRAEMKESALKKVKAGLILGRIAELEKITVAEDDINQELGKISNGLNLENLQKNSSNKANIIERLSGRILEHKTLQHLQEAARIVKPETGPNPAEAAPATQIEDNPA
jgi:trigger factor